MTLDVLRIYHSAVVTGWRERDRQLRALGCDVRLVSPRRWNEGGRDVELEVGRDEFVVPAATWGRHPFLFVYNPVAIARELRRRRIDVIDAHEEPASLAALELRALARLFAPGTPIVFYGAQNIEKRYPVPFRWIERDSLRLAAGAHCCNGAAAGIFRKKGLRGVVQVIGLGVDVERFSPTSETRARSSFVLGYVGRLEHRKGLGVVLDALTQIPAVRLDVYGDGPERAEFEAKCGRLGLKDRVQFFGFAAHNQLPQIYRTFNALVIPSQRTPRWVEQFGRVAVEAMASGVPVIASDTGALPEVIGDAGVSVPARSVSGWRTAIQRLEGDSEECARLAVAGRERAATMELAARRSSALRLLHGGTR